VLEKLINDKVNMITKTIPQKKLGFQVIFLLITLEITSPCFIKILLLLRINSFELGKKLTINIEKRIQKIPILGFAPKTPILNISENSTPLKPNIEKIISLATPTFSARNITKENSIATNVIV